MNWHKFRYNIRRIFHKYNYDLVRHPIADLAFMSYGINKVFDVGANVGQYAERQISLGYTGQIISFEPISSVFTELEKNARSYTKWKVLNCGLGNYDGEAVINISKSSEFSSLLKPTPFLNQMYPNSVSTVQEKIKIHKFDSLFNEYYQPGDKVFLKIDTEGYEKDVLAGAINSLEHISGLQLELSFKEHYQGELLFMNMVNLLLEKGFTLVALTPLYHNLKSGNILKADGIFWRL